MMIVPIWFSVVTEKKHHVHGNGYVDGSRKTEGTDSSGDGGGSGIVASNRKQIQIADLIVMRERMQLNHQTFFKQDIPLFSNKIPFCTATFRTHTHTHTHTQTYTCMLTRNISLATNVLVIIIVFLFAINSFFGISTNVWRIWTGFQFSLIFWTRTCMRACMQYAKFYSYVVRFHLFPFDDD